MSASYADAAVAADASATSASADAASEGAEVASEGAEVASEDADSQGGSASAAKSSGRADWPVKASFHGDVKTFFIGGVPYEWFGLSDGAAAYFEAAGYTEEDILSLYGMSASPFAQCVEGARLKLEAGWQDTLRLEVHWEASIQSSQQAAVVPGMSSGVGLTAPEAVKLTWTPDVEGGSTFRHRFDRLALSAKLPHVDITLGRQPISFGTGYFFTPLDLVNPFSPATIDTEYKPGVDALRIDGYAGTSGKLTLAAAYAGDGTLVGENRRDSEKPLWDDLVLAAIGRGTIRVTDLIGFLGLVHGEPVFGLGTISAIGPVGLHAEATVTLPQEDANDGEAQSGTTSEPFVRAVVGADWRPTATTTVMGEVYLQTFGASSPDGYLDVLSDARFTRGEVWQMGQLYAAISVSQEITPLVSANIALISNLRDPSALAVAGGSCSLADNATLGFGAYLGAGERPDVVAFDVTQDEEGNMALVPSSGGTLVDAVSESVNSEFGLYPAMFYLQMRMYF